ncbi:ABC transporter permease [Arthrobacter dokdonensis]|uniref:ABC transporter permease n=1 Tax=Arthrobacter dokdonellae TaxID=2211210 RepID=UPI000DE59E10|nr:ABC transporter permease [Arthrobacter dokdonellae]
MNPRFPGLYFLRLEIVRMLRDPKYLALAVLAPIGFYLLFATLFGGGPARPGELKGTVEIMVAMAAYGAIWAVLSTTAPRIAEERQAGWLRQLRAMPLPTWQVLAAKVLASVATALPAIVLVCTTAALAKGVSLTAGQWLALVGALWAGSAVFAALGIAIGYALGADSAYPVSYGLYMAMSAMGGLWVPPAILPGAMADFAHALPTYQLADLGWRIAGGQLPTLSGTAILAAWGAGLGLVAVAAYRRPNIPGRGRRRTVPAVAAPAA